jgi:hypothetical protein
MEDWTQIFPPIDSKAESPIHGVKAVLLGDHENMVRPRTEDEETKE